MRSLPRLPQIERWCVAKGVLPFWLGAVRKHQRFRRHWRDQQPHSLSEKVQYKLICDRRPIVRVYSDKLVVRDYVRRYAPTLALPRVSGVFDSVSELMSNVPDPPWVMKATHGSGMVLVSCVPQCATTADIRRRAEQWLRTDYALQYWEWQYHRLPRRIMFEEYLGNGTRVPSDYKFYAMHQRVRLITVDQGRFVAHTRNMFYPDWTEIPSAVSHTPRAVPPPARPPKLEEMIATAELLSRDSDFVRVDLYVVNDTVFFGEITHAPAAGAMDFEDPAIDERLGSYWTVPPAYV